MPNYLFNPADYPQIADPQRRRPTTRSSGPAGTGPRRSARCSSPTGRRPTSSTPTSPTSPASTSRPTALVRAARRPPRPTRSSRRDLDFLLTVGQLFALVVYGQLILEQAEPDRPGRGPGRPDLRRPGPRLLRATPSRCTARTPRPRSRQLGAGARSAARSSDAARFGRVWEQVKAYDGVRDAALSLTAVTPARSSGPARECPPGPARVPARQASAVVQAAGLGHQPARAAPRRHLGQARHLDPDPGRGGRLRGQGQQVRGAARRGGGGQQRRQRRGEQPPGAERGTGRGRVAQRLHGRPGVSVTDGRRQRAELRAPTRGASRSPAAASISRASTAATRSALVPGAQAVRQREVDGGTAVAAALGEQRQDRGARRARSWSAPLRDLGQHVRGDQPSVAGQHGRPEQGARRRRSSRPTGSGRHGEQAERVVHAVRRADGDHGSAVPACWSYPQS